MLPYMQRFRSVWCPSRKGSRRNYQWLVARDKNKNAIWGLLLFLLAFITIFQQNDYNQQIVLTPNEIVSLYCHGYPCTKRSAAAVVPFVNGAAIFKTLRKF